VTKKQQQPTILLHITRLKDCKKMHKPTGLPPHHSETLITFSEINHSRAITETNRTKFAFSAIMTLGVTQKRGIFVANSAKTALANYLL
jgi:hypothetical protein